MSYSRVSRAPGSGPADSPRGTVIHINITDFNIIILNKSTELTDFITALLVQLLLRTRCIDKTFMYKTMIRIQFLFC